MPPFVAKDAIFYMSGKEDPGDFL